MTVILGYGVDILITLNKNNLFSRIIIRIALSKFSRMESGKANTFINLKLMRLTINI